MWEQSTASGKDSFKMSKNEKNNHMKKKRAGESVSDTANFQRNYKFIIVYKVLLLVILHSSTHGMLSAQNSTSKVPIGAIKINIKTEDSDKIVYITGQVHLSLKTDTSKTYNYNNFKSLTLDINDGLSICQEDQAFYNNVFEHHYGCELICIEATKNYYRILVNNQGVSYWLRKSEFLKFIKIDEYLKGFGVFIDAKQRIYTKPEVNSPPVSYIETRDYASFSVVQVKGDWMEIRSAEGEDEVSTPQASKLKSGWIKWSINNKILIGLIDSM